MQKMQEAKLIIENQYANKKVGYPVVEEDDWAEYLLNALTGDNYGCESILELAYNDGDYFSFGFKGDIAFIKQVSLDLMISI